MHRLIILSITVMLVMVSGIAHSEQDIITQQEFEQREKDIKSGVAPRGTSQYLVGCVSRLTMHVRGNTNPAQVGAHFWVAGTMFGIQYNGIAVGSYVPGSLTLAQMAGFKPILEELRRAMDKKIKVSINYMDGYVWYIEALDTQPC